MRENNLQEYNREYNKLRNLSESVKDVNVSIW